MYVHTCTCLPLRSTASTARLPLYIDWPAYIHILRSGGHSAQCTHRTQRSSAYSDNGRRPARRQSAGQAGRSARESYNARALRIPVRFAGLFCPPVCTADETKVAPSAAGPRCLCWTVPARKFTAASGRGKKKRSGPHSQSSLSCLSQAGSLSLLPLLDFFFSSPPNAHRGKIITHPPFNITTPLVHP